MNIDLQGTSMQINEDIISPFLNLTIAHPHLDEAYVQLKHAIYHSSPGTLIFLYGPSGVGKSTLINKIYQDICKELHNEMLSNPVILPAIVIRAVAADSSSFNWKDYYFRLLKELNDVLPERKVNDLNWEDIFIQNKRLLTSRNVPSDKLRKSLETNLVYRKPVVVMIDEAQEIGIIPSSRKLFRQTNVIKSIAEETKINHVLSGTYDLLPLRNLNGQLSRRSVQIHFPRYDAHNEQHRIIFRSVLRTFQQQLPLRETIDLVSNWEFLYERCVGCVGTLKDWLIRSLRWAHERNDSTLKLSDLDAKAPSVAQSLRTFEEILDGEKLLLKETEQKLKLRELLGLKDTPKFPDIQKDRNNKKSKSVGIRRPKRDPISREDGQL